jgi:dUTP pyrophosphatase
VGLDLCAAEELALEPGARGLVGTGIAVGIPEGFEGQVRPRSGLAREFGVTVLNAPGTIDPDFTGELRVLLVNLGSSLFVVRRGMRIAQLVICPIARAAVRLVESLPQTARGAGGFGSTGR